MSVRLLTLPDEIIHLSGISWNTYETLLGELSDHGTYITSQTSQFFVNIPIPEMSRFLQQAQTMDYLELVKVFRDWVRSPIGK